MLADRYQKDDPELVREAAELACARERLALSWGALEREITRTFDWREWVRRKPGLTMTLAFGLGVFLGRRN